MAGSFDQVANDTHKTTALLLVKHHQKHILDQLIDLGSSNCSLYQQLSCRHRLLKGSLTSAPNGDTITQMGWCGFPSRSRTG